MWPKALLQLLELVPHFSRLLPMADKFFQNKTVLDDATLKTMDDLRGELGHANASHTGLYRQLNEQTEKLTLIEAETRATRQATNATELRLAALEKKLITLSTLLLASLAATAILLILTVILLLRH